MLFDLNDIGYAYPDGTSALEGISFSMASGESAVILGANGSGKSTLLRMLNGLLFPASGQLAFQGKELSEASLKDADFRQSFRQAVGFVFQNADAQLFNATVAEEVAFGPRQLGLTEAEVNQRVDQTLSFLGISHLSDRAPFRLSGGEKRKVAIASVLSMNPQVLLFDEPFLGLDPRGQTWLVNTMQQLQMAGKTTIVATHTLDMVPKIARVAIVIGENHRLLSVASVSDTFDDLNLLAEANLIEAIEEGMLC